MATTSEFAMRYRASMAKAAGAEGDRDAADERAREILTAYGIDIQAGRAGIRITAPPCAPIDGTFDLVLDPVRRVALAGATEHTAPGTWRLPMGVQCKIGVRLDRRPGDLLPEVAVVQTINTARRDPQLVARVLRAVVADVLVYSGDPAAVDTRIAAAGLDVGLTIDADAIAVTAHAPHGKFAWGGHCGNRVLVGPGYRISLGHVVQNDEPLSGVYQLREDPAGVEVAHWDDVEHPVAGFDEDAPYYEVQWWLEPEYTPRAALREHADRVRLILALALAYVDRVPGTTP